MTENVKRETSNVKPLTEAQRNHLAALNAAFMQTKQRMDEFIAYLRAEHDAPAPEWALRNLRIGFQKVQEQPAPKQDIKEVKSSGGGNQ